MQPQGHSNELSTLDMVARAQRRGIIRDRLVGAFLALGLIIGVTTIESMAQSASNRAKAAEMVAAEDAPVMLASALVVNINQ